LPAAAPNRVVVAILAFFFGSFGLHMFVLGNKKSGTIRLCLIFTYVGIFVNAIIAWIEAVIYLTKSDQEFYETYVVRKRDWF
jgi:TM2 domain-containing membrane protein YozV